MLLLSGHLGGVGGGGQTAGADSKRRDYKGHFSLRWKKKRGMMERDHSSPAAKSKQHPAGQVGCLWKMGVVWVGGASSVGYIRPPSCRKQRAKQSCSADWRLERFEESKGGGGGLWWYFPPHWSDPLKHRCRHHSSSEAPPPLVFPRLLQSFTAAQCLSIWSPH